MAQIFDGVFNLCCCQIRELHRRRSHRRKASGMLLAPAREARIRRADDPVRQATVFHRVPPIAVDAQRLNVDPPPVHLLNALHVQSPASGVTGELGIRNDRPHLIDGGMRMDVYHPHAASSDLHFPARYRTGGLGYLTRTSATLPSSTPLCVRIREIAAHG